MIPLGMGHLAEANNAAGRLIEQGRLDDAERALERIEGSLRARAPLGIAPDRESDPYGYLDLAMDEYFYRTHRVAVGWRRQQYAEILPHAQRAWALEKAIFMAARALPGFDADEVATSSGAWGVISVLTRSRRFAEAARIFGEVVADEAWFDARCRKNRTAAEKVLVAGLCVYLESRDAAFVAQGRSLATRARERVLWPEEPKLMYCYAVFWSLTGDLDEAFRALQGAIDRGYEVSQIIDDPALEPLHADDRWLREIVPSQLRWSLVTFPAGARVFLDGGAVGVTPMLLRRPPPGRYVLRFELAGHRQDEVTVSVAEGGDETSEGVIECRLARLVALPTLKEMAEDSARVPDAAARARTREFVGDLRQAQAAFTRDTTYGLGGLSIRVLGSGVATLHKQAFGTREKEQSVTLQLDAADVDRLFASFVTEAFTEIVIGEHSGVLDMLHFTIELTNGAGATHRLAKFALPAHDRFERLTRLFNDLTFKHLSTRQKRELR
jgi:PEGA domain-containing protein